MYSSSNRPNTASGVVRKKRKKKKNSSNNKMFLSAYNSNSNNNSGKRKKSSLPSTTSIIKSQVNHQNVRVSTKTRRRKRPFSAKYNLNDIYNTVRTSSDIQNISYLENEVEPTSTTYDSDDTYKYTDNTAPPNAISYIANADNDFGLANENDENNHFDMSYFTNTMKSKPHVCDICKRGFDSKYSMVCHRQKVHEHINEPLSPESPDTFRVFNANNNDGNNFNNMIPFVYSSRGTRQLLNRNKHTPKIFNTTWYVNENQKNSNITFEEDIIEKNKYMKTKSKKINVSYDNIIWSKKQQNPCKAINSDTKNMSSPATQRKLHPQQKYQNYFHQHRDNRGISIDDAKEKENMVYISKQKESHMRRELEVFQAIKNREKSLVDIQKVVHTLHTMHARYLRKEVEKQFRSTDVIQLINSLLVLRLQTLHVSTKLREWQHGVYIINKANKAIKSDDAESKCGNADDALETIFLWRGVDYSYKTCYDLAATIAALPRPLENWVEQYIPLMDNPLLLKKKLNAPNVPPKKIPKSFSFVLEHANKSPIRRRQKQILDEALGNGQPYTFPFDPAVYVAESQRNASENTVVSSAVEWPNDDCKEVSLRLKIQAARSLASLCTKVSQAKTRLEKKYNFVSSSSSFIVPNSSSIVSNTRDLNKPLSPTASMKVYNRVHDIESLLSGCNSNVEEESVAIEENVATVPSPSSAFLSISSFDDMKNIYELEVAVAKLIDIDYNGKHWGNEIRRAQKFFQEELHKHWLKEEAKRIKNTKLFAANLCKRAIVHATSGAHKLIMDKKNRMWAIKYLQRTFRKHLKWKQKLLAAERLVSFVFWKNKQKVAKGLSAFLVHKRQKINKEKRAGRNMLRLYRFYLVYMCRKADYFTRVQAIVRGYFGRQIYKRRLKVYKQWTAAHKIQTEWKLFKTKRSVKARLIQSLYRKYKSVLYVNNVLRKERLNYFTNEALIFNYADDRRVRDTFKGDRPENRSYLESGLLMPMGFKGNTADVEPWILRYYAVKKIQKCAKRFLLRTSLKQRICLKHCNKSALTIQCSYRCYRARVHLHSALLLAYFHMTAFIVQNAARKLHAKKELEDKRNKRSSDLNIIAQSNMNNDARLVRHRKGIFEDDQEDDDNVEVVIVQEEQEN
jgi:hypothetical protein